MSTPPTPRASAHEAYAELAAGWALHALEPDDEARFAVHLSTCAECRREVADYEAALAEVATAVPQAEPPVALGDRIRAAVRDDLAAHPSSPAELADRHAGPVDSAGSPHTSRPARYAGPQSADLMPPADADRRNVVQLRERVLAGLAAAAAAVAIILGVTTAVQYRKAHDAQQRADQVAAQLRERDADAAKRSEALRLLTTPGARVATLASTSSDAVTAYVVLADGQMVVLPDELAPNDTDKNTYVLWATGPGANPRALTAFDVNERRGAPVVVSPVPSGLDDVNGFAVSLEPGREMPKTPTDVVAQGSVSS